MNASPFFLRDSKSRSRGSAFVATIWIVAALSCLMLVIAQNVRIEILASSNRLSLAKAEAAEKGAEQFVLAAVDAEVASPGATSTDTMRQFMKAFRIGDAWVWIIRPDPDDETAISFGLTDEASKLDLNHAVSDQLVLLPNVTRQNADCILDWRTPYDTPSPQGAKDPQYLFPDDGRSPYHCKNGPYETVEELLLVKTITPELLFGQDHTRSGHVDPNANLLAATSVPGQTNFNRGIFPYVTAYGVKASTPSPASRLSTSPAPVNINNKDITALTRILQQNLREDAASVLTQTQDRLAQGNFYSIFDWAVSVNLTSSQLSKVIHQIYVAVPDAPPVAKININTAPALVLSCLSYFNQSSIDAILAHRQTNPNPVDPADISWLLDVVPRSTLATFGSQVTGESSCFSADILTCSADGRSFKRVRIVADASDGPAHIIYRRDLTSFGWPLDPQIRTALKNGHAPN